MFIKNDGTTSKLNYGNGVFFFLLLLFSVGPIFSNLDNLPIRLFDESRLANNALEMSRNHDFLVVQFRSEPEMWSVKPPLMIWSQVFFIKIVGENELAIRLPAALCGLLTILLIFLFLSKAAGSPLFGFMAALTLVATPGYIAEHGTRTGDYDSMLVLFLMMQFVAFYFYLLDVSNKKYWYLTCLAFILAVYTKGIAGLMFLPGLFLYALFTKKMLTVLKARQTWSGVFIAVVLIFGYYSLREFYNPGYIQKVIENEITYRYFDVNEGHVGSRNFYLDYLMKTGYSKWYVFAIAGVIAGLLSKKKQLRNLIVYTALNAVLFLTVISTSETKIQWYALPLFPLMAILTASCFFYLYELAGNRFKGVFVHLKWMPLALFAILFYGKYAQILNAVTSDAESRSENNIYGLGYVFQKASRGVIDLDGIYYCYKPYNAHLHFYVTKLEAQGQKVTLVDQEKLLPGYKVLAGSGDVQQFITATYKTELLFSWDNNVQLLLIR